MAANKTGGAKKRPSSEPKNQNEMKTSEIRDLIDFIAQSGLNEVDIETKELKLHVKREPDQKVMKSSAPMMAAPMAVAAPAPIAAPFWVLFMFLQLLPASETIISITMNLLYLILLFLKWVYKIQTSYHSGLLNEEIRTL